MILRIAANTLLPLQDEVLFRSGAVSALSDIQKAGFGIYLSEDDGINEEQSKLLSQEEITLKNTNEKPILSVSLDHKEIVLSNNKNDEIFRSENWKKLSEKIINPNRTASLSRTTNETDIFIDLNLDGTGKSEINTGLKFFDHMLEQIARHGLVDLKITCKGDLEVDEHHTIEDVAIALGETILKALGDKKGLERYGFVLAMDEAQATVALDLSNRPYLVFDVPMSREYVGDFPTEMLEHFYYSLAMNLKATLHVTCTGNNDHHKIEACFKGFARSLKTAIEQNGRIKNKIPSSKGVL